MCKMLVIMDHAYIDTKLFQVLKLLVDFEARKIETLPLWEDVNVKLPRLLIVFLRWDVYQEIHGLSCLA